MTPTYYKILEMEMGGFTGSRSANYHCYLVIYDENKVEMNKHPLSDTFAGKWRRCETVIRRWRVSMDKAKLKQL